MSHLPGSSFSLSTVVILLLAAGSTTAAASNGDTTDKAESTAGYVQKSTAGILEATAQSNPDDRENTVLGQLVDEQTDVEVADEESETDDTTRIETRAGHGADRLGTREDESERRESETDEQDVAPIVVDVQLIEIHGIDDESSLDPDRFRRAFGRIRNNIEACYENPLRQNPSLSGRARIELTIGQRGSRGEIEDTEALSGLDDEMNVAECIAREYQRGRIGRIPPPPSEDDDESDDPEFVLEIVYELQLAD